MDNKYDPNYFSIFHHHLSHHPTKLIFGVFWFGCVALCPPPPRILNLKPTELMLGGVIYVYSIYIQFFHFCFSTVWPTTLLFHYYFFIITFTFSNFTPLGWSSGGGTLQRLARTCFCIFVIWLLSSFSVGCSCLLLLVFFLFFVYLEFQIIRFVISTFTSIFFIEIFFVLPPPPPSQLTESITAMCSWNPCQIWGTR